MEKEKNKKQARVNDRLLLDDQLKFEKLLLNLTSQFVNVPEDQVDEKIIEAMRKITEFLSFDRCAFWQIESSETFFCKHSWTREGVKPWPFEETTPASTFPWAAHKVFQGEILNIPNLDALPAEAVEYKTFFINEGIKSMVAIPFTSEESALGTLTFVAFLEEKNFPDEMLLRLKVIGEVFSNILIRKRREIELEKLKDQIEAERNYLRDEIKIEHNFHEIIGKSPALLEALSNIEQVAPIDTTVLILGETGSGKELFARAVHHTSLRKDRPLIKVNCTTLPANLIESELFGYEKGAFTGANKTHIGRFELADGATLFLDEIGELPIELQPKLLRVIQEGEFERIGSNRTRKVDIRIIAATNRDLEQEVKNGRFREDLMYRLNTFPITVPPLRYRVEDIKLLTRFFINKFVVKTGKQIIKIPKKTMDILTNYTWPGNVRELENVIERSVILSRSSTLQLAGDLAAKTDEEESHVKSLNEVQRNHIINVLNEKNWRISGPNGAAKILKTHPDTLRSKMKKLDIVKPRIRY